MNDFAGLRGPRSVDWAGQGYGTANYAPDNMNVLFYLRSVKDEKQSRENNRPIHVNMDYIRMQVPGESNTVIDRPATDQDKHRFHPKWNAYLHDKTQVPEGTPIELLFVNNPAMGENLKGFGVYTVEQCANLSAHAVTSIGIGAQDFVNKAKAYLDSASRGSNFLNLERELKDQKQQNRMLQQNYNTLQAQLNALTQKMQNPQNAGMQPPWQPGLDAQAERLNANHPSVELAKKKNKAKVKVEEELSTDELLGEDANN